MSAIQLLAQKNFITFSKVIAKLYGVNAAILLGAMCTYQSYNDEQEFIKTQAEIADDTCLSAYEIRTATNLLQKDGVLIVELKGVPAQNHYKVVENKLLKILTTGSEKFTQLDVENFDNYTTNNTNIIYTNKKEKKKNNNKGDVCGTVDEVILVQSAELQEPLRDFVEMRKAIKKPITTKGLELAVKKLRQMAKSTAEAIEIINQSIMNSWQSFYPLHNDKGNKQNIVRQGSTQALLDSMSEEKRRSMGIFVDDD